jgi:hypothetical protein
VVRQSTVLWVLAITAALLPGQAAQEAPRLVVGVDAARLARAVFGEDVELSMPEVERSGIQYGVRAGGQRIGVIAIGVHTGPQAAIAAMEDCLFGISVGPDRDLSGEIGDRAVAFGSRRIVFARDNVFVSLSASEERLWRGVRAIDGYIVNGGAGVRRGTALRLPRVLSVDVPQAIPIGTKAAIRVHVAVPDDANADRLAIADSRGIETADFVPSPLPGEVEVVQAFTYSVPNDPAQVGDKEFWVCYATAGCIVVSQKVSIRVTAR